MRAGLRASVRLIGSDGARRRLACVVHEAGKPWRAVEVWTSAKRPPAWLRNFTAWLGTRDVPITRELADEGLVLFRPRGRHRATPAVERGAHGPSTRGRPAMLEDARKVSADFGAGDCARLAGLMDRWKCGRAEAVRRAVLECAARS